MTEEQTVVTICGPYPNNFQAVEISENKIFVFENDPAYEAVKVFDTDRNSVFVNSFLECEHYVTGGWSLIPEVDFIPGQDLEDLFQDSLLFLAIASILIGFIYIKKYFRRNI